MICIIDNGTAHLEAIRNHVTDFGHEFEIIKLDELNKADFSGFSGIIISGSPIMLTDVEQEKFIELFSFIKTASVPVLGICLGHQLMGLVYGAEVKKGLLIDQKQPIEIFKASQLFAGIENNSEFQESHTEYISLPEDFHWIAKSASCEIEAMEHRNEKKYGVQFHPEISGEIGRKLLKNFLNLC